MKSLLAGFAMIALVFSFGCYRGPYHAGSYRPGTTTLEHTDKIVYADNLTYKVYVVNINALPLSDGRMQVSAELENRTGKNLVIQVQTQFRDATGNLTEDKTNWRTIVMTPRSSTSYQAESMNSDARDYIVRVKSGERH